MLIGGVVFLGLAGLTLMALAAWSDLRTRQIANRLVLLLLLVAVLFQGVLLSAAPAEASGLLPALVAGVVVLGVGFALWRLGLIGGGDAKLLAAVAVLVGPDALLLTLFVTTFAGGGLALAYANLVGRAPAAAFLLGIGVPANDPKGRVTIPYGIAIAIGGAVGLYHTLTSTIS